MKKIIGIDFDGTCVTDLYPYVGDNIGAASVLRKLADRNLLILYTVRDGRYLQDAVDWFKYNHINLYSVIIILNQYHHHQNCIVIII